MKKTLFGKILVIGILILFAGASGIPSISGKNISHNELTTADNPSVQPLFDGPSYFLLLSDYTDGAGAENEWAVQLRFDSANLIVECEFDYINLPLILDQWTEIRVDIDLDGDWMEIYYDGDFLHEKAWTAGPNNGGTGELNIAAVDLYANGAISGATTIYYDDLSLEEIGTGIVWSDDFNSYTDGQFLDGTPDDGGWKGWDNDPTFGAYVTSTESLSDPHSVDVKGDTDLVHEYDGYTTGQYQYIAWVYIPEEIGDPPGAPVITGPTNGAAGTEYTYKFNAVDPDGDKVIYHITWGDAHTDKTDLAPSGTDVEVKHTYAKEGNYVITAYAEDEKALIGPVGSLQVSMPRAKSLPSLMQIILERFPNAFPILRQLLGL